VPEAEPATAWLRPLLPFSSRGMAVILGHA
jgi:hypothetical protein